MQLRYGTPGSLGIQNRFLRIADVPIRADGGLSTRALPRQRDSRAAVNRSPLTGKGESLLEGRNRGSHPANPRDFGGLNVSEYSFFEEARSAIDRVFGDTSVSTAETKERLRILKLEIDEMLDSLEESPEDDVVTFNGPLPSREAMQAAMERYAQGLKAIHDAPSPLLDLVPLRRG